MIEEIVDGFKNIEVCSSDSGLLLFEKVKYPQHEVNYETSIFNGCSKLTTIEIVGEGNMQDYESVNNVISRPWNSVIGQITTVTFNENIETIEQVVNDGISKILWINEEDKINQYIKEIDPSMFENVTYVTSQPIFLEFFNRDVNKGVALNFIAETLGVLQEEVVAVGDGLNDYEMISYAGLGVAMGNAHPKIKKIAKYITATNDEDGIADVIYELILTSKE